MSRGAQTQTPEHLMSKDTDPELLVIKNPYKNNSACIHTGSVTFQTTEGPSAELCNSKTFSMFVHHHLK